MFTLKIISKCDVEIYQSTTVKVIDEHSGNDELKDHIADCNIKAANLDIAANLDSLEPVQHDDMKAAIFTDGRITYLYPGTRCYITNDAGKTIHSFNYSVEEKRPANDFEKLVAKLAVDGGCIVSSADCGEIEIADAKCRDDFYATEKGYGYVRRLPEWLQKHSRFARGSNGGSCEERNTMTAN